MESIGLLRRLEPPAPALLAQYSEALSRESRRSFEKDPSIFWSDLTDEEGYPAQRARRAAERIFGGAGGRVLSDMLERAIEGATALKSARDYVEGIRLDVRRGGGVELGKGRAQESDAVAARFNLIMVGSPRIEVRTTLAGEIRTRVELPLSSPGIRATLSRPLGSHVRGSLSAGLEESGEERWISASLGVRF